MRARVRFALVVGLATLGGCEGAGLVLAVDLRTDYVPAVEFARVRVESAGSVRETGAIAGADYVTGVRVAELAGLPPGPLELRLDLLDASERSVAERRVVVALRETTAVTVVVTRDCRGRVCPAAGDAPTWTACVGGRCTDPACTPENPSACADPACARADDCPAAACALRGCAAGACLVAPGSCPAGQRCDLDVGCVREGDPDAGLDGGASDASDGPLDAGRGPDAAPPPCPAECTGGCAGGECVIVGRRGGGDVRCPPAWPCRVRCDSGNACDGSVTCGTGPCVVECTAGNSCRGTVDCTAASSCEIQCTEGGTCAGDVLCGAGPCLVTCDGGDFQPAACSRRVDCGMATRCAVLCGGDDCAAVQCGTGDCAVICGSGGLDTGGCGVVSCGTAPGCIVTCSSGDTCARVECNTSRCRVDCDAGSSCATVVCDAACACDVTCTAGRTCRSVACPAGCTAGSGCASTAAGCDRCP